MYVLKSQSHMYHLAASQLVYVTPCADTAVADVVVPEAWMEATWPIVRQVPRVLHEFGHRPDRDRYRQ